MSPSAPPAPERFGSTRHSACLLPVVSVGPVSQSCGYSTWTRRISPRSPAANHLAHPAHERIAGVIVGERKDAPRLLDRGLHLPGFRQRHRQRLVADDVHARFEEGVGRAGMDVVRRDDRDRLDPVGALGLGLRHALIVVIDAVFGEAERLARAARFLRRGGERAGDELIVVVHARGDAMDGADERALAAAHHAEPDPAALPGVAASLDGHARFSLSAVRARA